MEKQNIDDKKRRTDEAEPIRDGDARPDQIIGDADAVRDEVRKQTKDEVTVARKADVNSLEDFRDARETQ